jgi:hypothetical protein
MMGFRGRGLGLTSWGKQWVWLTKDGLLRVEALKFDRLLEHLVDHVTIFNLCFFSALAFDIIEDKTIVLVKSISIEIFEWALYQSWMKFEGLWDQFAPTHLMWHFEKHKLWYFTSQIDKLKKYHLGA